MFTVTDAACKRLSEMIEELPEGVSVRIIQKGNRKKITRGTLRTGDQEVTHNGRVVLRFGELVANSLNSKILDIRTTKNGPRLGLRGASGTS